MLKQRVFTAIILLAGFLSALFFLPQAAWLLLVAMIAGAGGWEWGGMCGFQKSLRIAFATTISLGVYLLGAYAGLDDLSAALGWVLILAYLVSGVLWLLVVPLWFARKWVMTAHSLQWLVGLVVLVPPALALAHLRGIDPLVLLGILVLVWVADIAAYFTGRAFGRHKLAPKISPGKTWEGAVGAAIGVMVIGTTLAWSWPALLVNATMLWWWLPLLMIFTMVSIFGDLFESLLKRQAGIKDSGHLLPGHGGILDRIDSLTSTLPVTALIVSWLWV